MKNVLISAYACVPDRGSEEGNGWFYSSLISQQGFRVWCLTRDVGEAHIERKLREVAYPNLTIVYVRMPRWIDKAYHRGMFGLYFHYLYWQWQAAKVALKLDKSHRFDLIHHVSYTSLQLGSFMYRLRRPFIFGPVGGGQEAPGTMRRYFKDYWLKERLRSLISRLMLRFNPACYQSVRRADRILVWNEDTLRMVRALGREKGVTKEFGGVSPHFIPAEPLQRPSRAVLELVWVGRLLPRKALELSLHGLSKVDAALPVHLTVVGDGDMGEFVPEYIARYGLQERVSWVGKVDYEQVRAFYRSADVFLFTSLRDTGPAQLLEAMAYALPVVTLDLHGQAELVDDTTGIRVPVTEPEAVASALARAIEWMYHHQTERVTMGLNAFRFAHRQTWDKKIQHIVGKYYTSVIENGTGLAVALGQLAE